jgi:hypothetical protein
MIRYILLCIIIYSSHVWGQLGNPPPAKPIVGVAGGDRKVTLYWNDLPEQSEDFEGYLILRSTEPTFKEVQIITDGFGNPTFYTPIAQFDKDNLWSGPHLIAVNGIKFNLGNNTGIVHAWTDSGHVPGFSLNNGQKYYYVVCSYDRGDSTLGMPPSISNLDVNYNFIYDDSNTVSIIPNAPATGYVSPEIESDNHISTGTVFLEYINSDTKEIVDFSYRNHFGDFLYTNKGPGTGLISVRIVDPSKIKENHEYQVVFQDTGYFHETISYSVYNLTTGDTLIKNSNQIHSKDIQQGLVFGINFEPIGSITEQWEWGPFFDGMNIQVFNHPKVSFLESNSGWVVGGCNYKSNVEFIGNELVRIVYPADYEIMFFDHIVDSSENGSKPTNFLVWNTTDNVRSDFRFEDTDNDLLLSPGDNIFPIIYVDSNTKYPWRISFIKPVDPLQGNYLELNGISDYATAEDDSSLDIGDESHESLTVEAWIYPKSFGSYIVSDEGYSFSTVPGKGVKFEVKSGEVVHSIVKTDVNFRPNRWHHVVGIFDNSANKLAIGFDGNIIWSEEDTTTFNLENTNSQLYVGTFDDTKGNFDGLIDELRISDIVRYPETNYDLDTYFFPDNSTRGLWHFNEDETSISFTDTSENGNILSAHGETKTGPTILIPPEAGDKFLVHCSKPFRAEWTNDLGETLEGDQFLFKTNAVGFNLSEAKTQLNNITVVPNPYVGAASWESNTDFGNGERKVYFIHLPPKATIRIYTISGHLVNKIEHNRPISDGAEPWDLKSKDGRDISYGVYIYHVDAPGIGNITGKFAVIK